MRLFLLLACCVVLSSQAFAYEPWRVSHQPPELADSKIGTELVIPASGLKRARVLIVQRDGYRTVEMKRDSDTFRAAVSFDQLAILKYQFQGESNQGRFLESEYFSVRQPASTGLEASLLALRAEQQANIAKRDQLQKVLQGVLHTDPEVLAKRRNEELARALVLLGQKERVLNKLKAYGSGEQVAP